MSSEESSWLSRLKEHLNKGRYSLYTAQRRMVVATRFLAYLIKQKVSVEAVEPSNVDHYVQNELRLYRKRHRQPPKSIRRWQHLHTVGIHMLVRLVRGQWPPLVAGTLVENFHRSVCEQYEKWMADLRGLASETRSRRCTEARQFLSWLEERGSQQNLVNITITDIDTYVMLRAASQRRSSVKVRATNLRSFLRYLHISGRVIRDLSTAVIGPTLYAFESIPSSLRSDEVKAVLETTRKDRSPKGLQDYAVLMLLSTYGLRAGEVTALRLSDVDWKSDILRIRHSKTGDYSELPLLPAVGNAILDYLRKGRPATNAREIFIRNRAPYLPLPNGSSLYRLVRNRLKAAGVEPVGKRGSHGFRHALAVSMLRAAVPIKEIGDVLGHRSTASTAVYLKLATEDLRAVTLEIPGEVKA